MTAGLARTVAAVVLALGAAACVPSRVPPAPTPSTSSSSVGRPAPDNRYAQAVVAAHRLGLTVWLEADLVRRWQEGSTALAAAIAKLAVLYRTGDVTGVKIADELGEDDGLSPDQVLGFLSDTGRRVRAALPHVRILVDVVVPELGCAPTLVPSRADSCVRKSRARWPGATLDTIDAVAASGSVDVLDVSTGLRSDHYYSQIGVTRDAVQDAAWTEINGRGWPAEVHIQSRKALAEVGGWTGTAQDAERDLHTWVDLPLAHGARAVDLWTWRAHYRGGTSMLLNAKLTPNALWSGLLARRSADRSRLFTHFSPSFTTRSVSQDLVELSKVFGNVFIAAGTG